MTRITSLLALTCVLAPLLACSPPEQSAPYEAPVTPAPVVDDAPAPDPEPDTTPDPGPVALPELVYYQISDG